MDPEILKYLAPLGVGGVLAWGMFLVYRKDSARWADQETKRGDTVTSALVDNTKAVTELTTFLRNGHAK